MTIHLTLLTSLVSRNAGGLFYSVRRLGQSLKSEFDIQMSVLGVEDELASHDVSAWQPLVPQIFPRFGPRALQFAPKMFDGLMAAKSDLVHVHGLWTYPSVACCRWNQRTGRPYLISPRGMLDPWALRNSSWKKRIASFLFESKHLHRAECLHALCASEAQSMRNYGLKNPISIVPNGVDLPELENAHTSHENARKNLLFLGRLHPKKGLENAIQAWKNMKSFDQDRTWRFLIAGWDQDGHVRHLMRLCSELGLKHCNMTVDQAINRIDKRQTSIAQKDRLAKAACVDDGADVIFLGPAFGEEKDKLLRAADAFILPSYSEGLPMAVLEAWAYGLPTLITQECNLPEGFAAEAAIKIKHDGTQTDTPTGKSLIDGFRQLIEMNDGQLCEMGHRGRRLVEDRFTWPQIASQMRDVYAWMVGGGVRPTSVTV